MVLGETYLISYYEVKKAVEKSETQEFATPRALNIGELNL